MKINLNSENRISIKRLTDADLKRSNSSRQTHIGLSEKSLTFVGDRKGVRNVILIHKNSWFAETCDIGKITRKNGRHVAPKISMGGKNTENLVSRIRRIASKNRHTHYLIWFASDTNTPVFWLIRKGSSDYKKLKTIVDLKTIDGTIATYSKNDSTFDSLVDAIGEL